jgi:cell division septation protein DedD
MSTLEILKNVIDSYNVLAQLVKQLIATEAGNQAEISKLKQEILEEQTKVTELTLNDTEASALAQNLLFSITGLIDEASAANPPAPVEPEPTPEEPAPVEPTPEEPAPVEPTPEEPAPVEPTPEEPAPEEPSV